MERIRVVVFSLFVLASQFALAQVEVTDLDKDIRRIIAGSCMHQRKPQPFWQAINTHDPDMVIFAGDNIYADSFPLSQMPNEYALLGQQDGFKKLQKSSEILAIWDDHDYGANDAGAEFSGKEISKKYFLDFWGTTKNDPRLNHDGIYNSYIYTHQGRSLQIILLDTRTFRSELKKDSHANKRYTLDYDPTRTMLGEEQWAWLESELSKEVSLRILVSSVQVLPMEHGFEKWGNFPNERKRLLSMLDASGTKNLLILSGDRHRSEVSVIKSPDGTRVLTEVTASGLNQDTLKYDTEPNRYRQGEQFRQSNFTQLDINWEKNNLMISIFSWDDQLLMEYPFKW